MEHSLAREIAGREIKLSTGKMALLSAGSVFLQMGETVVLATADVSNVDTDLDYFPLTVEYIERMYASGNISGSRFIKTEGHPSADAIIKARQIDHSIRSLFPKGFRKPVSVVITIMAYDGKNDPEALAVLGASTALMMSGIPYFGPCASVIAGVKDGGEIVINPDADIQEDLQAEYVVSGTDEKVLNIEGWSKEVTEETMDELIDQSMATIKELIALQTEFSKDNAKPTMEFSELPAAEDLIAKVKDEKYEAIKEALYLGEKEGRRAALSQIKAELVDALTEEDYSKLDIDQAVEYVARKALRDGVLQEDKRVSGRKLDEIRPLSAEVDVMPTVHGSALFARGLTQSMSITTLASSRLSQHFDNMEGEGTKGFMHHYNMPNYTTGEAGRYNYRPGRREIGHGMIGENALRNIIASQEDFPYAIRVMSEIMTSNGSTSMAATCAASMSLMAAGVPMKAPVAGIGVGLVTEDGNEDNYKLLLDIEGIEDFYGDMDFKVTGTSEGITAMQYENKLRGVKPEILKEALRLAKTGRLQVLEVMNGAISESRSAVSETAPKIEQFKIDPDQIGEVIGSGGKTIRGLVEEANGEIEIDIDEDGTVTLTAVDSKHIAATKERIEKMLEKPEVGKVYDGVIDKVTEYGAFVNVSNSITGLIHKSEISDTEFVKDPADFLKSGQQVKVKLTKMERGRQSFSMKGIPQQ